MESGNITNPESNSEILNYSSPPEIPKIKKIDKKFLLAFFVFIVVVLSSFYVYFKLNSNNNNKDNNTSNSSNQTQTGIINIPKSTPDGWKHYKQDTLGIEFDYPSTWGNIETSPEQVINDLKLLNKDFLNTEDNDFRYMAEIRFTDNLDITLKFINNEYKGERYPNSYAHEYGFIDNFDQLKTTKNICNYHIAFNHQPQYPGTMEERHNNCENDIKTVMVLNNPNAVGYNGQNYYNYKISQYFYKKLSNGYFDNLLIQNIVASTQVGNVNLSFDELRNDSNIKSGYQKNITDFEKLAKSIKVFTPPIPTPITFSQKNNEDPNITTIRRYYFYLATQKLSDAYAMYQDKSVDFNKFSEWYSKIINTNVYNIKQIKSNTYSFDVDLFEPNTPVSKYRVIMESNNNSINTLSSEQVYDDEVKINNLSSYTRTKSNKNQIILINNGQEKIIESCSDDYEKDMKNTCNFSKPRFSPKGNYLVYNKSGWEWSSPIIYDINKNEILDLDLSSSNVTFTKDEKNLIACSSVGISSGAGVLIYSIPSFKIKKDFFENDDYKNIMDTDCQYSSENSKLKVILTDSNNQQKIIFYDLNTNQIIP